MGQARGRWMLGRRRAVVRPIEGEDPYADYLAWVSDGRPALAAADLLAGPALPMPAADDAPEDPPASASAPAHAAAAANEPVLRRGRHSGTRQIR